MLKAKQIRLTDYVTGDVATLSNEKTGETHIRIGSSEIYLPETELEHAIMMLTGMPVCDHAKEKKQ